MPSTDISSRDDIERGDGYIILQLVSQTANDRYLAFGIRSDDTDNPGIVEFLMASIILKRSIVLSNFKNFYD